MFLLCNNSAYRKREQKQEELTMAFIVIFIVWIVFESFIVYSRIKICDIISQEGTGSIGKLLSRTRVSWFQRVPIPQYIIKIRVPVDDFWLGYDDKKALGIFYKRNEYELKQDIPVIIHKKYPSWVLIRGMDYRKIYTKYLLYFSLVIAGIYLVGLALWIFA